MDKPLTPTDLTRSRMNEADDKQEYVTFKLTTELGDELDSIVGKRLRRLRRDGRKEQLVAVEAIIEACDVRKCFHGGQLGPEYVTFKLTTKLADELESIAYKRLLRLRRDRRSQGSQSWRDDLGTAPEQLHKAITAAIIEQVDGRRDVVGYERPG